MNSKDAVDDPETWYPIRHDGFRELSQRRSGTLAYEDTKLADLVRQRLAGNVQQRRGAVLIAFRLEKGFLDEIAPESCDRVLIGAGRDSRWRRGLETIGRCSMEISFASPAMA